MNDTLINIKAICGCGQFRMQVSEETPLAVVMDAAHRHSRELHHTLEIRGEIRTQKPAREIYNRGPLYAHGRPVGHEPRPAGNEMRVR